MLYYISKFKSKICSWKFIFISYFAFFHLHYLSAQKYNFIQYNVEEGLVQSQAFTFLQSADNKLFIGTMGGLSQFDGQTFKNYSKTQGLPHNAIIALAQDRQNQIWIGTSNGISKFDGVHFQDYEMNASENDVNMVSEIVVDAENTVWAVASAQLYRLKEDRFFVEKEKDTVLTSEIDDQGKIWISIFNKGVFVRENNIWKQKLKIKEHQNQDIYRLVFGKYSKKLYGLAYPGIFIIENDTLIKPEWMKSFPLKQSLINSFFEDSKGNIWLTTIEEGGAWVFNQKKWIYYEYQNGFTDENINAFFEDKEQNIWMATDGSGIFRFTGNSFVFYDRSSGLSTPSVRGITQDVSNNILLAGNNGLFKMQNGKISKLNFPSKKNLTTNSIFTDSKRNTWLGTSAEGLIILKNNKLEAYLPSKKYNIFGIIHFYEYKSSLWISSLSGLFRIKNEHSEKIELPFRVNVTHALNEDSLILGTFKGGFIYNIQTGKISSIPELENTAIFSLASDQRYFYIGTDDRGIVIYDKEKRTYITIGEKEGLSCNYIYSLLIDQYKNLWVGTGCGIDKINAVNGKWSIRNYGQSNGLGNIENNANASYEDEEGYIWFGTSTQLFRYNPKEDNIKNHQSFHPVLIFESVKLFSKELDNAKYGNETLPFSNVPVNPVFLPFENHLSFTFQAVSLSGPKDIKYRYQLIGIDQHYTETNQNTVVYPNLPSGDYIFRVWASDVNGVWSEGYIEYPFTIITPFFKTSYFIIGFLFLILALFFAIVYYRNRIKSKRINWEMQLREEEQSRVRQKTAEDFHDEIGNKLTRINLLTTIAESKIGEIHPDISRTLSQIKENVNSLYTGSKDIIWSLQPESDYLDEIIWKIQQNTLELLEGSSIKFEFEKIGQWDSHLKLPIDSSRNLILIFKEAVNNMVKHAEATTLTLKLIKTSDEILIKLKDDGKGFKMDHYVKGNGLINIRNRAERIKANIIIKTAAGRGTEITIGIQNRRKN